MHLYFFFFQAEDGIRDYKVTGVQTCALPIYAAKELNVKPSTVQARMNGRKTRIKSHEEQQALTAIEELELVRWITQLTIAGYPPRPGTLKAMAEALIHQRVAQINDDGMELVSYPP